MSLIAWIAFARLTSVSYSLRKSFLDQFGGAQKAWEAIESGSLDHPEDQKLAEQIRKEMDWSFAKREMDQILKLGGWVLGYGLPNYPSWLSQISDPPLVLFGIGKLPPTSPPWLGFIGSRKPSTYGIRIARLLAKDLAKEGIVLVSGLARGIDSIAHSCSLEVKQPTVAVKGCGLDRVYPPEHAWLEEKIKEDGAVVTEFFLGEPPQRENFPRRNRIISGLSKGVLIVEAGEKSGAMITVRHALDQGREVYSVPGPIDSSLSYVPNRLISEGAKLVGTSQDVLEDFFSSGSKPGKYISRFGTSEELTDQERTVLQEFEMDVPMTAEDLMEKSMFTADQILSLLTQLEIKGVVQRLSDFRYIRKVKTDREKGGWL